MSGTVSKSFGGENGTQLVSDNRYLLINHPISAWSLLAGFAFASGRFGTGRFCLALIPRPVEIVERGQAGRSTRLLDGVDRFGTAHARAAQATAAGFEGTAAIRCWSSGGYGAEPLDPAAPAPAPRHRRQPVEPT